MLTELLNWFSRRSANRRRYPRRSGGFRAWFATESGWTPLTGLDVSASGMGVISLEPFPKDELNFRLSIEERPVLVRGKVVWSTQGTLHGKTVWRYGVRYTGISADDWDALVRFCSNQAVDVENKAQRELELVRMQPDDVARLLPQRVQERLLTLLVQARRLAPLEKEKTPLVQYFYGGTTKRNGRDAHRLMIHSRMLDEVSGEAQSFDTRFLFDENGTDIEMQT